MLIRTNIGQVIARLKRLDQAVPLAVRNAAAPGYWKPRLESVAFKTIRAQWVSERNVGLRKLYEEITPKVVETMIAEAFDQGTFFGLSIPQETVVAPIDIAAAAGFNIDQRTPTGRIRKAVVDARIFSPDQTDQDATQNLDRVRQVIRDWVMLEKERDARDYHANGTPLTDEEIAERIGAILGIGRSGVIPRARTPIVQAAAAKLTGAIQRWLAGEGNSPPLNYGAGTSHAALTAEVAAQWLQAVLLAWQKFLMAALPGQISFELSKVFSRIEKELL